MGVVTSLQIDTSGQLKTSVQKTRSLGIPLNVCSAIAGALRTLSLRSLNAKNYTATTIATAILKTVIAIRLNVSMCTVRSLTIECTFSACALGFIQGGPVVYKRRPLVHLAFS